MNPAAKPRCLTFEPQSLFFIRESRIKNKEMILKPQDILVLLKLVVIERRDWSYSRLAVALHMGPAEVHAAVKRAVAAQLAVKRDGELLPNVRNLEEFLIHGLRYVFVPEWGALSRGMPTLYAAAPLNDEIVSSSETPPVWPDPEGDVRGVSLSPLYRSAPRAARADNVLYEWLVLVDAVRAGRARERNLAIKLIKQRLAHYATC